MLVSLVTMDVAPHPSIPFCRMSRLVTFDGFDVDGWGGVGDDSFGATSLQRHQHCICEAQLSPADTPKPKGKAAAKATPKKVADASKKGNKDPIANAEKTAKTLLSTFASITSAIHGSLGRHGRCVGRCGPLRLVYWHVPSHRHWSNNVDAM
jgi:hypothetical protein